MLKAEKAPKQRRKRRTAVLRRNQSCVTCSKFMMSVVLVCYSRLEYNSEQTVTAEKGRGGRERK
jgi:hypothetical protein